jgi:hypothetical protein
MQSAISASEQTERSSSPNSTKPVAAMSDNEVGRNAQFAIAKRMQAAGASNANANARANAAFIHKLISDPNFRLEPKKPSAIEQHIEAIMKKGTRPVRGSFSLFAFDSLQHDFVAVEGFWDSFRTDLQEGKFERVIVLVGELRDRFAALIL